MEHLKQAEVFVFLASVFLIAVFILQRDRLQNPPIITLSEVEQRYRFPSGEARLSDTFRSTIRTEVVPRLDSLSEDCDCDIVEVVGHTDLVPVSQEQRSNLDREMIGIPTDEAAETLTPGSNMDLGMLRALAVLTELRKAQEGGALRNIDHFFPYSAGQVIGLDGRLQTGVDEVVEDAARRRIELRLRRSQGR